MPATTDDPRRHFLTRTDLATLAVPDERVREWIATGSIEQVGELGDGDAREPVYAVHAVDLRAELKELLTAIGKAHAALAPVHARSQLLRVLLAARGVEDVAALLEEAPVAEPDAWHDSTPFNDPVSRTMDNVSKAMAELLATANEEQVEAADAGADVEADLDEASVSVPDTDQLERVADELLAVANEQARDVPPTEPTAADVVDDEEVVADREAEGSGAFQEEPRVAAEAWTFDENGALIPVREDPDDDEFEAPLPALHVDRVADRGRDDEPTPEPRGEEDADELFLAFDEDGEPVLDTAVSRTEGADLEQTPIEDASLAESVQAEAEQVGPTALADEELNDSAVRASGDTFGGRDVEDTLREPATFAEELASNSKADTDDSSTSDDIDAGDEPLVTDAQAESELDEHQQVGAPAVLAEQPQPQTEDRDELDDAVVLVADDTFAEQHVADAPSEPAMFAEEPTSSTETDTDDSSTSSADVDVGDEPLVTDVQAESELDEDQQVDALAVLAEQPQPQTEDRDELDDAVVLVADDMFAEQPVAETPHEPATFAEEPASSTETDTDDSSTSDDVDVGDEPVVTDAQAESELDEHEQVGAPAVLAEQPQHEDHDALDDAVVLVADDTVAEQPVAETPNEPATFAEEPASSTETDTDDPSTSSADIDVGDEPLVTDAQAESELDEDQQVDAPAVLAEQPQYEDHDALDDAVVLVADDMFAEQPVAETPHEPATFAEEPASSTETDTDDSSTSSTDIDVGDEPVVTDVQAESELDEHEQVDAPAVLAEQPQHEDHDALDDAVVLVADDTFAEQPVATTPSEPATFAEEPARSTDVLESSFAMPDDEQVGEFTPPASEHTTAAAAATEAATTGETGGADAAPTATAASDAPHASEPNPTHEQIDMTAMQDEPTVAAEAGAKAQFDLTGLEDLVGNESLATEPAATVEPTASPAASTGQAQVDAMDVLFGDQPTESTAAPAAAAAKPVDPILDILGLDQPEAARASAVPSVELAAAPATTEVIEDTAERPTSVAAPATASAGRTEAAATALDASTLVEPLQQIQLALLTLAERPQPTFDATPLVQAIDGGFQSLRTAMAESKLVDPLADRIEKLTAAVIAGNAAMVESMAARQTAAQATVTRAPLAGAGTPPRSAAATLVPIFLMVMGWVGALWLHTGDPRMALVALFAANLFGCLGLLYRRS